MRLKICLLYVVGMVGSKLFISTLSFEKKHLRLVCIKNLAQLFRNVSSKGIYYLTLRGVGIESSYSLRL